MTCPCDTCDKHNYCAESAYECIRYHRYVNAYIPLDLCPVTGIRCGDYDSLIGHCYSFNQDVTVIEDGNCPAPRPRRGRPPKKNNNTGRAS